MDKRALYKISYGIYLITSTYEGGRGGQIANTLFQVTSEPLRVAVALNKNNFTHELIKGSRAFGASILSKDTPLSFIGRFGFKFGRIKGARAPKTAPTYREEARMPKYKCKVCGYIYDPERGDPDGNIPPGTLFENLPENWLCPVCGAYKEYFEKIEGGR